MRAPISLIADRKPVAGLLRWSERRSRSLRRNRPRHRVLDRLHRLEIGEYRLQIGIRQRCDAESARATEWHFFQFFYCTELGGTMRPRIFCALGSAIDRARFCCASAEQLARYCPRDTSVDHPLPRRRERTSGVDRAARVLDDDHVETGFPRIDRRVSDAKVGGKTREKDATESALAQITCEAGERHAVRLAERRIAVDFAAISLAHDELGLGYRKRAGELGAERFLDAMIRPEDLRAVRKQDRLEWSPPGMARGERQVSGDVPILVKATCPKRCARELASGMTASPSGTARAPPGRKSFCKSTTRRTSQSEGFMSIPIS